MEQLPSLAFMSSASSLFAYGDAWSTILWITSLTFVFFIVAPSVCWAWNRLKKNNRKTRFFYYSIAAVAIIGATWSFLLPIAIDSGFRKDDDGPVLRQILLYATGGLLGVITLGETHRKNNQEREKNENDHTRQMYAERRSRYTKAVEQLANEKAAVRLGGIYTLVGLVDEWLADDTLESEEQQKEGQVIINNLCSYIRSSFPLAEKREVLEKDHTTDGYDGDFTLDRAQLCEEQDVRRAIFEEMSKRSSTVSVDKSAEVTVTPGAWSTFEFNFSRAPIFYPLNNLTIEQGNFASTRFYGEANFRDTKFAGDANFRGAAFTDAYFWHSTFTGNAYFWYSTFTEKAEFLHATFAKDAYFSNAFVWNTTFAGETHFGNTTFNGETHFENITFNGDAYFNNTTFNGETDFRNATFSQDANFSTATFTGNVDFRGAKFIRCTRFGGAKFIRCTSFEGAYFEKYAPIFADDSGTARFSDRVNWEDSNFSVRFDSQPIERGSATLGNKTFRLPLGTILFDPTSWDEQKEVYTRVSAPAK